MKKIAIALGIIAAVLPFVFKSKRVVDIRLAGSGPDVVYRVLFEGKEVARMKKGEEIRLTLSGRGKAIEIAVGDIVIRSSNIKPKIFFDLPPLQNPKVDYTFEGSTLVISGVTDEGPYPVDWKVDESNDFPMRVPMPSTPTLEGYIEKKRVYSKALTLSRISSITAVYDGNSLEIHPVLSGFFKTDYFSINGLEVSSPVVIKALSLPNGISVNPIYGNIEWDGITFKTPKVPDVTSDRGRVAIEGNNFYLNDSPASGILVLPDGTSTLKWVYEEGKVHFERVWKFYIDRKPPVIEVSLKKSDGSLLLNLKSDEWSSFRVKFGPILMSGEGTEVSFRIKKILGRVLEISAIDRSGNITRKVIDIKEVRE